MDITKITDINELKALAYDQLVALEQAQQNLAMIQKRMGEVAETREDATDVQS